VNVGITIAKVTLDKTLLTNLQLHDDYFGIDKFLQSWEESIFLFIFKYTHYIILKYSSLNFSTCVNVSITFINNKFIIINS